MGLWDNCVSFSDVRSHLLSLAFSQEATFDDEPYLIFRRGRQRLTVKRPNVHGKVPLINIEDAFDEAGLEQPAWALVSCEY